MANKDVEKDLTNGNADEAGAGADAAGGADVEEQPTTKSVSQPLDNKAVSLSIKAKIALGEKVRLRLKHDLRHPFLEDGKGRMFDKDDVVLVELDSWFVHQIDAGLVEVVK